MRPDIFGAPLVPDAPYICMKDGTDRLSIHSIIVYKGPDKKDARYFNFYTLGDMKNNNQKLGKRLFINSYYRGYDFLPISKEQFDEYLKK